MTCHVGRTHDPLHVTCIRCEMEGAMICHGSKAMHLQALAERTEEAKKSKYRNHAVTVDGIRFDSKKEAGRFQQLTMMERAGKIAELRRQVPFELAPAVRVRGKKKPALRYVADFCYLENGRLVVEDTKGMLTDVYKIKRHLMVSVHGIEIRETGK